MIALYLLAAHVTGDFLLQSRGMAEDKFHDRAARLAHVTVYALCFVPIAVVYGRWGGGFQGFAFVALLAVGHYLTDSRRWHPDHPWPLKGFMFDQSLHVVQLAVLGGLILDR